MCAPPVDAVLLRFSGHASPANPRDYTGAMTDLNPDYVHVVVDHFRPRVKAEQDRVAREMGAAFPGCSIHRHTYDVDYHMKHPGPWAK